MKTVELPPDPSRLIEGLRDTGYDFNTALADIVDNSVDAEASTVSVRIDMDIEGAIVISVADNGCGMDEQTLMDGMRYGATGRPDPRRLGKFGLGLKTASTAFCRRLTVVTRASASAPVLKAVWDIDHVKKAQKWELIVQKPGKDEIALLNDTAHNGSGTVVLWEKVDRVLKDYSNPGGRHARKALEKVVGGFRDHAAMVYQRFLDKDDERARHIEIALNGKAIEAWDPFCRAEDESEVVAESDVDVGLPSGKESAFNIRAVVLPRKEQFSTPAAADRAQPTNRMQGIYIYRENRLIHPHDWMGMYMKEPHYSLLRVEFSFDHTLDEVFSVDIKKSRIALNEELYEWIMSTFLPAPRNAANDRYRKGQRKKVAKKAASAHADSNASIGEKAEELSMAEVTVVDAEDGSVDIKNRQGTVRTRLKIRGGTFVDGEVHVHAVDGIDDGLLWQPAIADGHHAVEINRGHPYYHKVYVPNLASGVTIQGMDALLWAMAEAELGTINKATKDHFSELRFEVSRLLRRLVEDLPEPELEE